LPGFWLKTPLKANRLRRVHLYQPVAASGKFWSAVFLVQKKRLLAIGCWLLALATVKIFSTHSIGALSSPKIQLRPFASGFDWPSSWINPFCRSFSDLSKRYS
jgi:hypothetical protein